MALGMEMLLQSMNIDPTALQNNVNTAVAHVKQINDGIAAINQRLSLVEQGLGVVISHTTVTSATTLRIEDAVNKLREDAPDNSRGFAELAAETFPDAATTMQQQIEGGLSDARTEQPAEQPKYVNGSGE